MGRYLIRRLVWAVVLFIAITLVTYVIKGKKNKE